METKTKVHIVSASTCKARFIWILSVAHYLEFKIHTFPNFGGTWSGLDMHSPPLACRINNGPLDEAVKSEFFFHSMCCYMKISQLSMVATAHKEPRFAALLGVVI